MFSTTVASMPFSKEPGLYFFHLIRIYSVLYSSNVIFRRILETLFSSGQDHLSSSLSSPHAGEQMQDIACARLTYHWVIPGPIKGSLQTLFALEVHLPHRIYSKCEKWSCKPFEWPGTLKWLLSHFTVELHPKSEPLAFPKLSAPLVESQSRWWCPQATKAAWSLTLTLHILLHASVLVCPAFHPLPFSCLLPQAQQKHHLYKCHWPLHLHPHKWFITLAWTWHLAVKSWEK